MFTAYSVPRHYLNQCWLLINWTSRNKLQWISNQNSGSFLQINMSSAKWRPIYSGLPVLRSISTNLKLLLSHKIGVRGGLQSDSCFSNSGKYCLWNWKSWKSFCVSEHGNGRIVILTTLSSPVAPDVIKMTNSGAEISAEILQEFRHYIFCEEIGRKLFISIYLRLSICGQRQKREFMDIVMSQPTAIVCCCENHQSRLY